MIRLQTNNNNSILTEKQQKYLFYHLVKLININILQAKNITFQLISNQFTRSPLGKALKKQEKKIESQGVMQRKTIEEYGKQLVKSSNEKVSPTLLKPKKNFDKIFNGRRDEIQHLSKQINYIYFTYYFKTKEGSPKYFVRYKPLLGFLKSKRDGGITMNRGGKNSNQI